MSNPPPDPPRELGPRVFFVALDGTGHIGNLIDAPYTEWAVIHTDDRSLWTVPADRVICEI